MSGLSRFLRISRAQMSFGPKSARIVHRSSLLRSEGGVGISAYFAQKAPLFYRALPDIISNLEDGFLLTPFKETLARLPTAESFRQSHFGEIAACLFAEEVMGLRRVYSKLSLLTAENANAYKMDLLLYDPQSDPIEFVFAEVKSSAKTSGDGLPPGHDTSCFASLFASFNSYNQKDLEFDLAAIKDRLPQLPTADRERIRLALLPYSRTLVRFAGFVIIDESTLDDNEARVLASRRNDKVFDVDLVCVDGFPVVASDLFGRLEGILEAVKKACS